MPISLIWLSMLSKKWCINRYLWYLPYYQILCKVNSSTIVDYNNVLWSPFISSLWIRHFAKSPLLYNWFFFSKGLNASLYLKSDGISINLITWFQSVGSLKNVYRFHARSTIICNGYTNKTKLVLKLINLFDIGRR